MERRVAGVSSYGGYRAIYPLHLEATYSAVGGPRFNYDVVSHDVTQGQCRTIESNQGVRTGILCAAAGFSAYPLFLLFFFDGESSHIYNE